MKLPAGLIEFPQNFGFVLKGYGPGAYQNTYCGKPLIEFLTKLCRKQWALGVLINRLTKRLDVKNPGSRMNKEIVNKFLLIAHWAYAVEFELYPHRESCFYGPTDPIGGYNLKKLDEIFSKCFSVAHVLGTPDQSMVGLKGLLTDFERNGGINRKTGGEGGGFEISLHWYYTGHVLCAQTEPITYQKFGELIEAITKLVTDKYPKVRKPLSEWISCILADKEGGFGNETITSPAKTEMMEKLAKVAKQLLMPADKKEDQAIAV